MSLNSPSALTAASVRLHVATLRVRCAILSRTLLLVADSVLVVLLDRTESTLVSEWGNFDYCISAAILLGLEMGWWRKLGHSLTDEVHRGRSY